MSMDQDYTFCLSTEFYGLVDGQAADEFVDTASHERVAEHKETRKAANMFSVKEYRNYVEIEHR